MHAVVCSLLRTETTGRSGESSTMSRGTPIMTIKEDNDDQQRNSSLRSSRDDSVSESVWLFKKYLLTTNQNKMNSKTTVEADHKLEFPDQNNFRHQWRPSLLEQALLPQLRSCGDVVAIPSKDKSSKQLTIFFDGVINVYDNIPVDKAQEIMRLAGESSTVLLKPVAAERPKPDVRKPSNKLKKLSVFKLRAGLPVPMARKYSLQCFLEKRRDRILHTSPYILSNHEKQEGNEARINKRKGLNEENQSLLPELSPFPSTLGYFSLKSSHQD